MARHSHEFVETYDGLVGFGMDRKTDAHPLTFYLQKFSDDELMSLMGERMNEADMTMLFDLIARLLKTYLTDDEYHRYFLKDNTP